jgi:MerR family transcriptional regulator, light-induced transcriptional regulator
MTQPSPQNADGPHGGPARFRSGAVAQMLGMPVTTLRVWERRYRVCAAPMSGGGHRRYSMADVERLLMMHKLTQAGHAIGSIAMLDAAALSQVMHRAGIGDADRFAGAAPWTAVVVGDSLQRRLQAPMPMRRGSARLQVAAAFGSTADWLAATPAPQADASLVSMAALDDSSLQQIVQAASRSGVRRVGIAYGYAASSALRTCIDSGIALAREPLDEVSLMNWLDALGAPRAAVASGARAMPLSPSPPPPPPPKPPRFSDEALAAFASTQPATACECPRHVAELLLRLTHFEAYSAQCAGRNPSDTSLHRYLHETAGLARGLMEQALERVAQHEGIALPGATLSA